MRHNNRPALVIGADGVLGSALVHHLRELGQQVVGTSRRQPYHSQDTLYIDLANEATFKDIPYNLYQTAYICGAITSLHACEADRSLARKVNLCSTVSLMRYLITCNVHIIFLSSSTVFDGSVPFVPADYHQCPVTEYGRHKVAVEKFLQNNAVNYAVIRFGKIIQPSHPLFSAWLKKLRAGKNIYPYQNKTLAPISLRVAVNILAWLGDVQANGIFQATASSEITYAEAAHVLADLAHCDQDLVKPVILSESNRHEGYFSTLCTSPSISQKFGPLLPTSPIATIL